MSAPVVIDPQTGEILDASGVSAPEAAPLPQAMSLDEARALLSRAHRIAVADDDPVLMSVTLHQGFLADFSRLLQDFDVRQKKLFAATGDAYAKTVENVLDGMKDRTIRASIETAAALIHEQAESMLALKHTLRKHQKTVAVAAALSWAAAILTTTLLYLSLR